MDMFTLYGHIIKLKQNYRLCDDLRPGHVHLTVLKLLNLHCGLTMHPCWISDVTEIQQISVFEMCEGRLHECDFILD